ncbi:FUSC family protein [Rubellimicrobium roseum]|uniref:Integral membrane bound transporter domain-containing protein n=1 Tax=Rubellimicrobium roseum TaxID=687525 RepID=A0A5C4N8Y6_9RHOB|nr:FUSC family protein [Rubellimicrobium roseum]TNC69846.1 hypothetical protein FHG71_13590 [Rubellimicrobium roseum]
MLERLRTIPREDWRDAIRRGLQAALAGVGTYAAVRALGLGHEFLAVLGAALILTTSIGGTMGAALTRIQATVVGSLLGLACLLVLPDGWGTMGALALSLLVVGGVSGLRSDWSYGMVAAVGIALASQDQAVEEAVERTLALAIGAGIGVLVSLLAWPDRAEARFDRHLREALRATATRLSDAIEATMEPSREAAPADHVSAYHRAVGRAQDALDAAKLVERDGMRRRLEALRRLYNSVIILDRAAESDEPPVAGARRMREEVEHLRREACRVLTSLARGERSPDPGDLDPALERLEKHLAGEDPATLLHGGRGALDFGLREVRRTLADLIAAESAR